MPGTITLTLEPARRLRIYPARLHGAVCALLEAPDSDHERQHKPFAAGPLRDTERGTVWQIGWLGDAQPPRIPDTVRFGETPCSVRDVSIDGVGYAALARSKLAAHAQIETLTPMYFSRRGRDYPLPDPVLIVGNLVQRWNVHAPTEVAISEEGLKSVGEKVILHDMAGETLRTPVSATMKQVGYFGSIRLGLARSADTPTRALFAALMRYATMSGVGAQTPYGFGAIELTELTA